MAVREQTPARRRATERNRKKRAMLGITPININLNLEEQAYLASLGDWAGSKTVAARVAIRVLYEMIDRLSPEFLDPILKAAKHDNSEPVKVKRGTDTLLR